jgi:competence protein ComEC
MRGRLCLLAFVGGSAAVHTLAHLPSQPMRAAGAMFAMGAALVGWRFRASTHRAACLPWLCMAAVLGFVSTAHRAHWRLEDHLSADNQGKVSRVIVRVTSLVELSEDQRRFRVHVVSSRVKGVPETIQVSWSAPGWAGPYGRRDLEPATFPEIMPGQVWRMALTLRSPSGLRNPHGFDYEGFQFARGIRAVGSVRGVPSLLSDDPWVSLSVLAERARHKVREAMLPYVHDKRYGGVLLALAIGDQDSIGDADWQVFNKVALTHAIAISGSHITMIAAIAGASLLFAWRRARIRGVYLAERCPAQVAAALAALGVAWLYCLLAGWGVPAQRTFLMLAVVALAYACRLPVTPSRVVCVAAFLVVLFDPWSVFSTGFWLSFGAVYVLIASNGWVGQSTLVPSKTRLARWRGALVLATRLQLTITFALAPALAYLFHEVSLISPLANAYGIPVLGLVVTPLALLLAGASVIPGMDGLCQMLAWLGHAALLAMMAPTQWLAQWPMATVSVAAGPAWVLMLAGLGVLLATQLHGLRFRFVCWALILPMMLWRPSTPAAGAWRMTALDVGQGSAVLIQTRDQTVLYDTGLRYSPTSDAGQRIILPFLKSLGVSKLDALVVSHADIDHAGGMYSMVRALAVDRIYASFDVHDFLKREALRLQLPFVNASFRFIPCRYGEQWQADKVVFAFFWPTETASSKKRSEDRNAKACVLRVQGLYHAALLPGDIGHEQERVLIARGLPTTDVVLAAHHGSRNSSHPVWVGGLGAQHAIAQAGFDNRYGHPAAAVQQRWLRAGAQFWRTDLHGAVIASSLADSLQVHAQRGVTKRYWHDIR